MKIQSKPTGLLRSLLLTVALGFSLTASATVINPSNADNIFTAANTPTWLNNAVYENAAGVIYVVTWDDGTNVNLAIMDNLGHLITPTLAAYSNSLIARYPDVAIGGDNGATTAYVTVSYTANVSGAAPTDVYLEEYAITNIGTVSLAAALQCGPLNVSNSGDVGKSHIDTKSLQSGTTVNANGFAVAWEDMACTNTSADFGVAACVGTYTGLAATCATNLLYPPTCITSGMAADAVMVDVEYGQQRISPSVNHNMAYFIFVDPATSTITTRKWDINTNSIVAGSVVQNNGTAGIVEYPRISGLDDVLLSFGFMGIAFTWRFWDGSYWQIKEVNNANNTIQTLSGTYPATSDNYWPVIASSPITKYSVAYENDNYNDIYVQNLDVSNGNVSNTDHYKVNMSGNTVGHLVAAAHDFIYNSGIKPDRFFIAWWDATNGDIMYKVTQAASNFKPGRTGIVKVHSTDEWEISPIPASDRLRLKEGTKEGKGYSVTDLTGRTVASGSISQGTSIVDVESLPAGMYMLNITNKDNTVQRQKFIKE